VRKTKIRFTDYALKPQLKRIRGRRISSRRRGGWPVIAASTSSPRRP